jgi:aa3 type cytochrome c oxidase subunit IV
MEVMMAIAIQDTAARSMQPTAPTYLPAGSAAKISQPSISIQDDYAEHIHDYRQFLRVVQLVVAGVAIILLLLAFFLL